MYETNWGFLFFFFALFTFENDLNLFWATILDFFFFGGGGAGGNQEKGHQFHILPWAPETYGTPRIEPLFTPKPKNYRHEIYTTFQSHYRKEFFNPGYMVWFIEIFTRMQVLPCLLLLYPDHMCTTSVFFLFLNTKRWKVFWILISIRHQTIAVATGTSSKMMLTLCQK